MWPRLIIFVFYFWAKPLPLPDRPMMADRLKAGNSPETSFRMTRLFFVRAVIFSHEMERPFFIVPMLTKVEPFSGPGESILFFRWFNNFLKKNHIWTFFNTFFQFSRIYSDHLGKTWLLRVVSEIWCWYSHGIWTYFKLRNCIPSRFRKVEDF